MSRRNNSHFEAPVGRFGLVLFGLILAVGQGSALASPPRLAVVVPEHVFAPQGFDDNDNAQVVVSGAFPTSCYRSGPVSKFVDRVNHTVTLRVGAYVYDNPNCQPVTTTYTSVVDLGLLPQGDYTVRVEGADGGQTDRARLPVEHSTTARPDNFLYAWVQEARVRSVEGSEGVKQLTLSGRLGGKCYKVARVGVYNRPEARVIEVLPIVELVPGADCGTGPVEMEEKVDLQPGWTGSTLIHIRSLSGQSLNRVVQF